MNAYVDVDYVGLVNGRRSTSDFCTYFGGNLMTFFSKKQTIIDRSSSEVEYRSMAYAISKLTWLKSLLGDLGVPLSSPAVLLITRQLFILLKIHCSNECTKNIDVDCHFIMEKDKLCEVQLRHVLVISQVTDILTKALSRPLYLHFVSKLGAHGMYAPA